MDEVRVSILTRFKEEEAEERHGKRTKKVDQNELLADELCFTHNSLEAGSCRTEQNFAKKAASSFRSGKKRWRLEKKEYAATAADDRI